MRMWMCDDCNTLHGATVKECAACGSDDLVVLEVDTSIVDSFS